MKVSRFDPDRDLIFVEIRSAEGRILVDRVET
jgi:hypothetical protein